MRAKALILTVLLVTTAVVKTRADEAGAAVFECRFTENSIRIDGRADEAAWKHAQAIDRFYIRSQKDAAAARTTTKARLLWDRDYLYFFADMEDADLFADVKEHDGRIWTNDSFGLYLKPAEDKPGLYEFQANAAGAVLDMFVPQPGKDSYERFHKSGDFHLEVKVV